MPSNFSFPPLPPGVSARFDRILSGIQPMFLSERGPAVAVVQRALIGLGFKIEGGADGAFGARTQTAVKSFQSANASKVGKPDGIVGPRTLGVIFASPFPPENLIPPSDFVIFFDGNEPSIVLQPEDVIDVSGLRPAFSEKHRVTRLGFRTTQINSGFATASFAAAAQALNVARAAGLLGRVYIFGASAGGRMAISFAERLTLAGIPLRLVAITDAALFQDGTISDPTSTSDDLPTFLRAVITADIKLNYFHRLGNKASARLLGGRPLLWKSGMTFNEVHGEVVGFGNSDRDLTDAVKGRTNVLSSDLTKHIECNRVALGKIRPRIIADLNSNL